MKCSTEVNFLVSNYNMVNARTCRVGGGSATDMTCLKVLTLCVVAESGKTGDSHFCVQNNKMAAMRKYSVSSFGVMKMARQDLRVTRERFCRFVFWDMAPCIAPRSKMRQAARMHFFCLSKAASDLISETLKKE